MDLFHTTDIDGISELNPSSKKMREILASLDDPDTESEEYPDVSLVHDSSGWSLSAFPSGVVTFENLDDKDRAPRYIRNVSRDEAHRMWLELSRGEIESLNGRQWRRNDD